MLSNGPKDPQSSSTKSLSTVYEKVSQKVRKLFITTYTDRDRKDQYVVICSGKGSSSNVRLPLLLPPLPFSSLLVIDDWSPGFHLVVFHEKSGRRMIGGRRDRAFRIH